MEANQSFRISKNGSEATEDSVTDGVRQRPRLKVMEVNRDLKEEREKLSSGWCSLTRFSNKTWRTRRIPNINMPNMKFTFSC